MCEVLFDCIRGHCLDDVSDRAEMHGLPMHVLTAADVPTEAEVAKPLTVTAQRPPRFAQRDRCYIDLGFAVADAGGELVAVDWGRMLVTDSTSSL